MQSLSLIKRSALRVASPKNSDITVHVPTNEAILFLYVFICSKVALGPTNLRSQPGFFATKMSFRATFLLRMLHVVAEWSQIRVYVKNNARASYVVVQVNPRWDWIINWNPMIV